MSSRSVPNSGSRSIRPITRSGSDPKIIRDVVIG